MKMLLPALVLILAAAVPQEQKVAVAVTDGDPVLFEFPKEFRVMKIQPKPELPTTLKITNGNQKDLSVLVTIIPDKENKFQTEDDVRKAAVQSLQYLASHSVEKRMDLKSFENRTVRGFYSSFTDESLVGKPIPEGKYLKVTSGLFAIGRTAATFTILYNDSGDAPHKAVLEALNRVRLVPQ